MPDTTHLDLPLIEAAQAQKHVTHNEALVALDVLVQLAVLDRDLTAPPGSPAEGDRYIVAASPTGAWSGHATHIAYWHDSGWLFRTPAAGWIAFAVDEATLLYWNGTAWVTLQSAITALQNLALLGVGTTADGSNPFSAKLNNALWTAKYAAESGDGDLRFKFNKETASDTASLLFQTNFSGRAEIGTIGSDDLTIKVSPDGAAWTTALTINKTTGTLALAVDLPVSEGGTGASSAAAARTNLGVDQRTAVSNADATIASTDRYVGQTGTMSAPHTWTLPAATAVNAGQKLIIADESGTLSATNTLTLARAGSDTVNGATSTVLSTPFATVTLVSNGSNKWTHDIQGITRGGTGATTAAAARANLVDGWGLMLPETRALINAMTAEPRRARTLLIDAMLTSLVDASAGLWGKILALWVMAAANSQAALLNWKAPGTYTLVPTNSPTFSANQGYQGDGSTSWLDAGVTLASLTGYAQDDAGMFVWSLTDSDNSGRDIGTASSFNAAISGRSSNLLISRANDGTTNSTGAAADSLGLYGWTRNASGTYDKFRGGSIVASPSVASTGIPGGNVSILRSSTGFSPRKIAIAGVTKGLTSGNISDLNTILAAYIAGL